ncbi:hypothetical protein [Phascolarctobacterium succinatutens]
MCSLANRLDMFIRSNNDTVFIEAEGKYDKLVNFIRSYNSQYGCNVNMETDGIMLLGDVDKWGVELRLYLNHRPDFLPVTSNRAYRSEYPYRINDNNLIREMFDIGYRIGVN